MLRSARSPASRLPLAAAAATLALAVAAPLVPAASQEITWSGQVRPRAEVRDPAGGDGGGEAFTSMRTRVGALARLSPSASAFVQIQDVRTFGEETSTLGDFSADGLDVHQAWVQLGDDGDGWSLRVGRQEAAYGGQRLVGAVGWAQQARAFDGARVRLASGGGWLDLFGFQLAEAAVAGPTEPVADAAFLGAYGLVPVGDDRALDLYGLWNRDEGPSPTDQGTAGFRYVASHGTVSYRVESALQFGERAGEDVSAWFAGARVGSAFADGRATATLWFDHLSGDDSPDENGAFSTLFATNHKFYGYADLFLNPPAHTAGRGLQDLALKTTFDVGSDVTLAADLHHFRVPVDTGLENARLANELDLTASRPWAPGVRVTAGLSRVWAGDAIRAIGRLSEDMWWGYVMLDAAF